MTGDIAVAQCQFAQCDEDPVLWLYIFTLSEGGDAEGLPLCLIHMGKALKDLLLGMTDPTSDVHHVIIQPY